VRPYHETRFTDRRKNGIAMGLGEKGIALAGLFERADSVIVLICTCRHRGEHQRRGQQKRRGSGLHGVIPHSGFGM
jgi:hypothetical protein